VIGQVHPNTAPARAILEKEGFSWRGSVDIFDAGPVLEAETDAISAVARASSFRRCSWEPRGRRRRRRQTSSTSSGRCWYRRRDNLNLTNPRWTRWRSMKPTGFMR
jgi:hypothetical protein